MKVLLFLGFIGAGLCLNVPSRSRSDPCSTSPCATDATCETSPNGFAFCRCKNGFTGDAFTKCEALKTENSAGSQTTTSSSQSHTMPMMNSGQTNNPRPYPTRFTVDYQTDTNAHDMSRVPILGSAGSGVSQATPESFNHNRINTQFNLPSSTVHETVVHTHISRHPQIHQSHNPIHNFDSGSGASSVVSDPMGQYSNCRSIRGVIVCADNSLDDSPNTNPSFRPEAQQISNDHQIRLMEPNAPITNPHNLHKYPHTPFQGVSSTGVSHDCKSLCGINSVCRMVNSRPVCGCPVDHTGDPGIRCDPIVAMPSKETETTGCQKHPECLPTQICEDSKCIDPCKSIGGICGKNAECIVMQHTQLCRCGAGFNGNPYTECFNH